MLALGVVQTVKRNSGKDRGTC